MGTRLTKLLSKIRPSKPAAAEPVSMAFELSGTSLASRIRPEISVRWGLEPMRVTEFGKRQIRQVGDNELSESELVEKRRIRMSEPIDISHVVRRRVPLTVINTGSITAYNVKALPITGTDGILTFADEIPFLEAGKESPVSGVYKRDTHKNPSINFPEGIENFFLHEAFLLNPTDWKWKDAICRTVTITYEDSSGAGYRTKAKLLYASTESSGRVGSIEFTVT